MVRYINDYGLGFYCTDSLEMAKEWGVAQNRNGYANRYELDCEGLKILDLNGPYFQYPPLARCSSGKP